MSSSSTVLLHYCCSSCCPTRHLSWSYPESSRFLIMPSSFPIKCVWRTSTSFPSLFWFLRNIALPITNQKTAWTWNRMRRQPSTAINGHQYDYDFGFLGIAGSAILVLPQTQNIAGGKISGFEIKAFTRQNYPDSNVFGFKVPTLDSGFNISGEIAKLGCFQFGFVVLCVNGKTNPVFQPENLT